MQSVMHDRDIINVYFMTRHKGRDVIGPPHRKSLQILTVVHKTLQPGALKLMCLSRQDPTLFPFLSPRTARGNFTCFDFRICLMGRKLDLEKHARG